MVSAASQAWNYYYEKGNDDGADLFAKHFPIAGARKCLAALEFEISIGRADGSLTVSQVVHAALWSHDAAAFESDHWISDAQCVMKLLVDPRRNLF